MVDVVCSNQRTELLCMCSIWLKSVNASGSLSVVRCAGMDGMESASVECSLN